MMKYILLISILITTMFAQSENVINVNKIKQLIQKEEFISIAVNKYILQTGKIPITDDDKFDWNVLFTEEYLGENFSKIGSMTNHDLNVEFEGKNIYIHSFGDLSKSSEYNKHQRYLYNFYIDRKFRTNTQPSRSHTQNSMREGTLILLGETQNQIVQHLKNDDYVRLDTQDCPNLNEYYELKSGKLTLKYCKDDSTSVKVYQEEPIYLEDAENLKYIKAKIGSTAYANKNGNWYEYYYQGDVSIPWVPKGSGEVVIGENTDDTMEDKIISYIPNSKDIIFSHDGGCMLANGDIFCWGDNKFKRAGLEGSGQLSTNLKADYINTPVMLKVQIDNITKFKDDSNTEYTRRDKRWYNNPYRVKFEKIALNETNVCGISPLFKYFQDGKFVKFGGDLYCNGRLKKDLYDDISSSDKFVNTAILKRNKFFYQGKENQEDNDAANYLIDIAMVDGTIAVLTDTGKLFTIGSNEKGALGIDNNFESFSSFDPLEVTNEDGNLFRKIYALREFKSFGALDEFNNFWIWGERHSNNKLIKPTKISNRFITPIFVNSKDFVLKGIDKKFYRTYAIDSVKKLDSIPSDTISVSLANKSGTDEYLYVDKNLQLKGTSKFRTCKNSNDTNCSSDDNTVFNLSFNKLNTISTSGDNKDYATFSNIGIFDLEDNLLLYEDFEDNTAHGWANGNVVDGNDLTGKYLGRFGQPNNNVKISKTYDFGYDLRNKSVTVSFDFYEIDSIDSGDNVEFRINNSLKETINHRVDQSNDGEGVSISPLGSATSDWWTNYDEKHYHSYSVNLDSNGRLKLEFKGNFSEALSNESWGIDNIKITLLDSKRFVCSMTGLGSNSQMYCWGQTGRSIPVLSTSLYDISKITTLNKLFINSNNDKYKQITENNYNSNGRLFLKYPTYIGGFDYEFYFK